MDTTEPPEPTHVVLEVPSNKTNLKKILVPEEMVDEIAKKVVASIENTMPVKRIRKSQILTVLLGVIGFSIFTLGISKLFADASTAALIISGLVLMVIGGVSLQNTLRQ